MLRGIDAGAAFQVVDGLAGQLSVAGEGAHGKVYVPIVRSIGMPLVDEGLNQVDDLLDMLRGPGVAGGPLHPQGVRIHVVFLDVAVRDLLDGAALLIGLADELIVDVGEILDEFHLVAPVLQVPAQGIEHHEGPGVANMEVIIHRRAAHIHADLPRFQGDELFLFAGHGVIDLHGNLLVWISMDYPQAKAGQTGDEVYMITPAAPPLGRRHIKLLYHPLNCSASILAPGKLSRSRTST